jgi:formamidase
MKWILWAAALCAAAAAPSFAKTIRIPVTRGAGGVPVPCGEDPLRTCHNRWHPDIPEVAEAHPGDTVIFETRDAFDNPFNRTSTPATVAAANLNLIHPLTGPLYVKGAKRGDVLAVTMIDVGPGPDNFGYTVAVPGFGFLARRLHRSRHRRTGSWAASRSAASRYATSRDLPGVRLPLHGFAGTIGVELGMPEIENGVRARGGACARSRGSCFRPSPPTPFPPTCAERAGAHGTAACAPFRRARTAATRT